MSEEHEGLSQKEEYIAQCMTSGKTREECEQLWNESHRTPQEETPGTDVALTRMNAMQAVKISQLEAALREATGIIKAVNLERDAVMEARKYELALELEKESDGRLRHNELMKEELKDLTLMKKTIDTAHPKNLVSVSNLIAADNKRKKPTLSVGEYDTATGTYKGGI